MLIPEPHCRAPRVVQRNVGAGHGENWPLKPLQLSQQQQPALDATPWHAVAHGREAQPPARALFDDRPVFECASSRARPRALLALKWLEEPKPARSAGEAPELATAQVPRDLYEDVVAEERQVAPFHPAYQSQRELACLRAGYDTYRCSRAHCHWNHHGASKQLRIRRRPRDRADVPTNFSKYRRAASGARRADA